ncbi:TorF family putative porin [Sphingomonas sp.]|jgi:uncharacterized protein (TIGR02001 family)|uniref:TorF family putative porin n=1 Tax=Sphingomonas sp. TaxID=28214 RepID=UPI002DF0BCE5|nr:TorF family putative porin [Sphingomonas sp.]
MRTSFQALTMGLLLVSSAAHAQEEEASGFTISGSVVGVSDYRFRGVSQSDKDPAVQGTITVTHKSGLYVGVFGSNLAGWGTFGGPNLESDIFGGYKFPIGESASIDVGLTWYMYAGGVNKTDFAEPYVKVNGTVGPVALTAGVAYAPSQEALGRWYRTGAEFVAGTPSDPGDKEDNLYIWGDAAAAVPGTPLTVKGHLGYSDGNSGLGPNGTSVAPTGKYLDWLLGIDGTWKNLTLGVAYVDTDISNADRLPLLPNFGTVASGKSISDSTVVFSITAAF